MGRMAILSSKNEKCGVREYGRFLVKGFNRNGVEVEEWRPLLSGVQYELVIVNYQDSTYPIETFNAAIASGKRVIIIFHDLCINQKLNVPRDAYLVTHAKHVRDAIRGMHYFPMPIPNEEPMRVGSFGLGRNDHDLIERCCKQANVEYDYWRGDNCWVTEQKLREYIRNKHCIVFWYPPCSAAGTSFGVRLALSERAKVVVNDTEWFNDVPEEVIKVRTEQELVMALHNLAVDRLRGSFVEFAECILEELYVQNRID